LIQIFRRKYGGEEKAAVNPFPIDKLVPQSGVIRSSFVDIEFLGPPDGLSHEIEIRLKPFQLPLIEDGDPEDVETVETSIRLDYITLIEGRFPGFKALEGREFTFPVNPEPGYIEGSVYMYNMHNDVDVTKIIFGKVSGNHISATIVVGRPNLLHLSVKVFPGFGLALIRGRPQCQALCA
jgi:hypothetical protein